MVVVVDFLVVVVDFLVVVVVFFDAVVVLIVVVVAAFFAVVNLAADLVVDFAVAAEDFISDVLVVCAEDESLLSPTGPSVERSGFSAVVSVSELAGSSPSINGDSIPAFAILAKRLSTKASESSALKHPASPKTIRQTIANILIFLVLFKYVSP